MPCVQAVGLCTGNETLSGPKVQYIDWVNKRQVNFLVCLVSARISVCRPVSGLLQVKGEITSVTTSPLRCFESQDKGRSSAAVGVARQLVYIRPPPAVDVRLIHTSTRPRINIT